MIKLFSYILVVFLMIGCSSKDNNDLDTEYSELPVKKDLSFYSKNQPIVTAGEDIFRIQHYTLSAYEKGRAFAGASPREEQLKRLFFINRYEVGAIYLAKLDSSKYSQFELDDFEKKLKDNFKDVVPNIQKEYSSIDRHIRIVGLKIPVKYSKNSYNKNEAIVEFDKKYFERFKITKTYTAAKFVKDVVNNDFINKHIIDKGKNINFIVALDNPDSYSDTVLFKILNNAELLNNIGKKNKGKDFITELTLHIENPNRNQIMFGVTSFKLQSVPDKRFITNTYIDKLDDGYNINPSDEFLIRDDDVKLLLSTEKE